MKMRDMYRALAWGTLVAPVYVHIYGSMRVYVCLFSFAKRNCLLAGVLVACSSLLEEVKTSMLIVCVRPRC